LEPPGLKSNLEALYDRVAQACKRSGRSPDDVQIIAVTKTVNPPEIEAAFDLGLRNFGENRVQEAEAKLPALSHLQPRPAWHMIGHLQSNKVKAALELFDMVQSVDSLKLAENISGRARRKVPVLLQVNVAGEATKSGFSLAEIRPAFEAISSLEGINVMGLMTIAPIAANEEDLRPVFRRLREQRDEFHLEHLSMGMTDDFEVAIEEGATMVRIGRAIFGERR
jgi:pyridoxal phosphate enzyme (YggS family)